MAKYSDPYEASRVCEPLGAHDECWLQGRAVSGVQEEIFKYIPCFYNIVVVRSGSAQSDKRVWVCKEGDWALRGVGGGK